MARLSQLTELDVRCRSLRPAAGAALRQLPLLASMRWASDSAFLAALMGSIAQLAALTRLSLISTALLPPHHQLSQLAALEDLTLMQAEGGPWEPPLPASFPSLRAYKFDCQQGGIKVGK